MPDNTRAAVTTAFRSKVLLKDFCTYKTGGPAKYFYSPKTIDDIRKAVIFARESGTPFFILGNGSNVLFSDRGFDGLVIRTVALDKVSFLGNTVTAGCGVPLADLVEQCCRKGLKGVENLSMIPGSVGGAVFMNAGAFEQEIGDVVEHVVSMDREGLLHTRKKEELGFAYRSSVFKTNNEIILSANLGLSKGDPDELVRRAGEIEARRKEKQPWDAACCGSVFKRPPGGYAGPLIEKCGLKGRRIGGAGVSEKHANFIINHGSATSADIKMLVQFVQKEVLEKTGVNLETEVLFIGDF